MTPEIEKNIESFFLFINERENIRVKKEDLKLPFPWTEDEVLRTYSFTNVKRANDRTTRWVNDNWYSKHLQDDEKLQFINCGIFRWFGTVEFGNKLGWQNEFFPAKIEEVARFMLQTGQKVFTGAYIITNGGISGPKQEVVINYYLKPLWNSIPDLLEIAESTKSWEAVARAMSVVPGHGGSGFMTKEVLLDVFHTSIFNNMKDEKTWTPIGPGARRGLNRIYGRLHESNLSTGIALKEIREIQTFTEKYWKHSFELYTTDIQFQLCEFDKYQRVRNNQGRPRSTYKVKK
jgi:hypothetical protein